MTAHGQRTAPPGQPAASLKVELGRRSYHILVGEGLVAAAGRHMLPVLAQPRTVIVTDSNVAPLYLAVLEAALDEVDVEHTAIVLPAGEQTKDFGHLRQLTDNLLDARVERSTTVVALGGGVVGDIAGFAAAITLRGLACVQVPTTLLSQVDSAVGGKTGINTAHGKNLIGAFHQPCLVLADIATLDTLAPRELRAGYAEVVKYGVLGDPAFFAWLEANGRSLLDGDTEARRHAVLTSCAAKAAIVADDERETGRRALLNLGHTFGHALEVETGYGDSLMHGEAVAIGMVLALDLSVRLGLCPPEDRERVRRHLAAAGLPVGLGGLAGSSVSAGALLAHMGMDKKVRAGKLTFVLVRGIGKAFIAHDVDPGDVGAVLENAVAA